MAHDAPKAATNQNAAAPAKAGMASRLLRLGPAAVGWAMANRLRALLSIGTLALGLIGAIAAGTLAFKSPAQADYRNRLAGALEKYDGGDRKAARQAAAKLLSDPDAGYAEHGGAFFLLGAITLHEADQQLMPGKRQLLSAVAARYLEEARTRGIPEGRAPEALAALGRALHEA